MTILFDGEMFSSHFQGSLLCNGIDGAGVDCFTGQSNGLLGAAHEGALHLTFGVHTALVKMRILLLSTAPELDARWEEAVEASFVAKDFDPPVGTTANVRIYLIQTDAPRWIELVEGAYRVRFTARNFGLQEHLAQASVDPTLREEYELTFWNSTVAADSILKATSDDARIWHQRMK